MISLIPYLLLSMFVRAESPWPELGRNAQVGGGERDAAVIVGAENYAFVEKIPGARKNAEDWQAYLTESLKVPAERVALLRDHEATLEDMRRYAAEKAAEVEPGGTLWFIFIGHGAPSKDGTDGLLVGADAQQKAGSLYARSLSRGELLGTLAKGKQAKTVVLLDACFSGRSPSGQAIVKGLQPLIVARTGTPGADPRTILLTAAKSDQFAGPLPKAESSRPAFSYLALGGLKGWAADPAGKVTASGLIAFVSRALKLAKDRVQTPELSAGGGEQVLGEGREKAPDLAKIDREGGSSDGFQISADALPAVPRAEAPRSLDSGVSGLDFRSLDLEALERYNAVFEFDKGDGSPETKAQRWRELAGTAPKFKELADKRAREWDAYAAQKRAADEARSQRLDARDADWAKLGRLLSLSVIPAADKARWAGQFAAAYAKNPGVAPVMAKALLAHVAAGPHKIMLEAASKQPDESPAQRYTGSRTDSHALGIQWVSIPGGSFVIGRLDGTASLDYPAINIRGFEMAKAPVTRRQYRACVEAKVCPPQKDCVYAESSKGDDNPATCVPLDGARAFSQWVGGRLPSEAEWEYAARSGGKAKKYPWGDAEPTCQNVWAGSSACGREGTGKVCSLPAGNTEQGLCDMGGNVLNIVEDSFSGYNFKDLPADGSPRPGGAERIMRGNAWHFSLTDAHTQRRLPFSEVYQGGAYLGFRPVRARR